MIKEVAGAGKKIYDILIKKIPNFAVRLSKENTNPVNYL